MKSKILIILLLLALLPFYSSAQKSQKGKGKQSNSSNSKATTTVATNNAAYQHYTGTLQAGAKATLDLMRLDTLVYGNYFDNSINIYVYLTGSVNKNQAFKLSVTDGRASATKKKEFKNFSITGTFSGKDSLVGIISKTGSDKADLKFVANYSSSLPFELVFKQNMVNCKNKKAEAKALFSMSSLNPSKAISPITDSISLDAKKLYFPKTYKQLATLKLSLIDGVEKDEFANWKKSNQAFCTGKSKTATNTERTERAEVFFNSSDLLCIGYYSYADNGGMHPNSFETYKNYDIAGKSVLKLSAIFNKDALAKLPSAIASSFLKKYNEINGKSYTKIGDAGLPDDLPLPETFAFNQTGMYFIYNEGELGMSYTGKVSVFISFSELKSLINPQSPLLKLF